MAIINSERSGKKVKVSVQIDSALMKKIEAYCAFVDIDDFGYFFEEASKFIFRKDRKWKNHLKKNGKKTQKLEQAEETE